MSFTARSIHWIAVRRRPSVSGAQRRSSALPFYFPPAPGVGRALFAHPHFFSFRLVLHLDDMHAHITRFTADRETAALTTHDPLLRPPLLYPPFLALLRFTSHLLYTTYCTVSAYHLLYSCTDDTLGGICVCICLYIYAMLELRGATELSRGVSCVWSCVYTECFSLW